MLGALIGAMTGLLTRSVSAGTATLVVNLVEQALNSAQSPDLGAVFGLVSAQLEAQGISAEELDAGQALLTDLLRLSGLVVKHNLLPAPTAAVSPQAPPA